MSDRAMIPVDGATAQLLAQCGDVLINVVTRKFGVCAVLHNMESRGGAAAPPIGEKRCWVRLPGGPEVSVWKDDLTTHRVDAVVNAANEHLHHGGGLAAALSLAAGPQLEQMSDRHTKVNGKVATGQAVSTPPGKLRCKAVIHAVGPCVPIHPTSRDVEKASPLLKRTVESILYLAEKESYQTVAIPALSSGLFNFPLALCAELIVSTVKDYTYMQGLLSEVRLVNHDERTVSAMESALRKILPVQSKASNSGAVQDDRSSLPASTSLQMGSVTMHIKKGQIELEQVDVIVNTISQNLDLSMGNVSKAILNKAGYQIQSEISSLRHSLNYGDVIETHGHNLNSSKVYHTVCAVKADRGSKILLSVVKKCMDMAVTGKHSSISFPAIGTGNLSFKEEEVAKLMIGEVADFAKKYKGKKMDVYFVLFPSDMKIIKAFEHEMCRHKEKEKQSVLPKKLGFGSKGHPGSSGADERDQANVGGQPCIELRCASETDDRETRRWINDKIFLTGKKCTIINNHILHFGQSQHKKLLSFQATFNVSILEFLRDGLAGVAITGRQSGVQEAALRAEALCCEAQEEFARAEESAMMHAVVRWKCTNFPGFEEPEITSTLERARLAGRDQLTVEVNGRDLPVSLRKMEAKDPNGTGCRIERMCLYKDDPMDLKFHNKSFYQRTLVNPKDAGFRHFSHLSYDLDIIKIEKVENPLLEYHFQQKQRQVPYSPKSLYQQVPAQFCDLVCRVGFQRQYSPPKAQKFGAGIYFAGSVSTARQLAEHLEDEEYIYIFEAQVLTGKDTRGSPNLIIPPARGSDPFCRYDSVTGGVDTHVIFNSHQALPVYLLTCKKKNFSPV